MTKKGYEKSLYKRLIYLANQHRKALSHARDPMLRKLRHSATNSRTRIKRAERQSGDVTANNLKAMGDSQGWRCALTGDKLSVDNVAVDHIVPMRLGGAHTMRNVHLVTQEANRAKGGLPLRAFVKLCRKVVKTRGRR